MLIQHCQCGRILFCFYKPAWFRCRKGGARHPLEHIGVVNSVGGLFQTRQQYYQGITHPLNKSTSYENYEEQEL